MIGVLFGNFCSSCFIKISVSFYVKITFFPDFFDDLTPVAMESYYQCSNPDSNEKNWTGHIRPLNINRNEFEVTARGSTFHLLVGKHAYGKYLCIPNWGTAQKYRLCRTASGTGNALNRTIRSCQRWTSSVL